MRTTIKVRDLNLRQWDYLTTQVKVDGRDFLLGLPRVCVEFELTPDFQVLHIEMDVAEFVSLTCALQAVKNETVVAEAALTPDAQPDEFQATDQHHAGDLVQFISACTNGQQGAVWTVQSIHADGTADLVMSDSAYTTGQRRFSAHVSKLRRYPWSI